MQKLLFIDHAYHQQTRSADFFVDVLRKQFDVATFYLTPEGRPDLRVLAAARKADIIVLWQMDFLAPALLTLGKPVIVIPMFDGSGGMPNLHWLFAQKARFFNFSLALNERIRMAGGKTMLLRYFPEPAVESELPRFDKLRAFFWQRRPDHGVDLSLVDKLLGNELDSLHVHNVADIPGNFRPRMQRAESSTYAYSESVWFKQKSDYVKCLANANVFIAPRVAEGIGMALLEAMAQGKLVLAHDAPTNSEYISSGCNGILFHKDHASAPIHVREHAAQMGRMAWRTVVEGRKQWLAAAPAILDWVEGTVPGPIVEMDHEAFFCDLWHAYYASLDEYSTFLSGNLALLGELSDQTFEQILDVIGEARADAVATLAPARECALDEDGVMDLTLDDDRFTGTGWSNAEDDWRWAIGYRSELHFTGLDREKGKVRCTFAASALPNLGKWVQCSIMLNEKLVFNGKITPGWSDYRFEFDASLLRDDNRFTLSFDKALSLPTDSRMLSVCFRQFTFGGK